MVTVLERTVLSNRINPNRLQHQNGIHTTLSPSAHHPCPLHARQLRQRPQIRPRIAQPLLPPHHIPRLRPLPPPPAVQFDAIVSPANSYGRLDGGFDDAISRALSPRDDYLALTRVAQQRLYDEWRGFAPPGTCTLVRVPPDFQARSKNVWGTKYLALCPTMRIPQEVTWDREVVYECIWSLLCAVDKHNRSVHAGSGDATEEIRSLLMVPMGTSVGQISAEKWASQTALALKHYIDAVENPTKWSALEPIQIYEHVNEVVATYTHT
ncbi:hypothetical protein PT974_05335 [Cladobotryum mycophilum]|uniref:Macro domain-like protein n=1 Tax=Cladobotryum mycophilum TaxID=491253 RepID=A0ABR0SIG3_9HYPO